MYVCTCSGGSTLHGCVAVSSFSSSPLCLQIVDNEDIWGGTTLVNSLIPSNIGGGNSINVNISVQAVFQ